MQTPSEQISAVMLDVQMPGLDGVQTLEALRQINPQVHCCFMSGFTGKYTKRDLLGAGAMLFLDKPFSMAQLGSILQQLNGEAPARDNCPQ